MPVKKLKELLDSHRVKYVSIVVSRAYTAQDIGTFAHGPGRELAKAATLSIRWSKWTAGSPWLYCPPRIRSTSNARV
jgi:hypothetical protein